MSNAPQTMLDEDLDDASALPRRSLDESADLDITPMIDCVFLLLIFFLVSSTPDSNTSVSLPEAKYGGGVSQQSCVIITIADPVGDSPAAVYLGDGTGGTLLPGDSNQQEAAIVEAVNKGFSSGEKTNVLIKAGKDVPEKYIAQVGKAVNKANVKDAKLRIGVFEKN